MPDAGPASKAWQSCRRLLWVELQLLVVTESAGGKGACLLKHLGVGEPSTEKAGSSEASGRPPQPPLFPELADVVTAAIAELSAEQDPLEATRRYGHLLEALHREVLVVQSRRDGALAKVLGSPKHPSHFRLAKVLGISRQRVDQIAARTKGVRP